MKSNYSSDPVSSKKTSTSFKHLSKPGLNTYAVFGGQGIDPMPELRSFFEEGDSNSEFWDVVFISLKEEYDLLESDRRDSILPFGFPLKEWLLYSELSPATDSLKNCAYSVPLIFITQAAALFRIVKEEREWDQLQISLKGIFGHSQGIYAGLLLSSSNDKVSFLKNLSLILRNLLHLGIRSQEEFPILEFDPSLRKFLLQKELPSPMAALKTGSDPKLNEELDKFNSGRSAEDMIHVGLKNGPRIRVLCGSPEALVEFRENLSNQGFPDLDSWSFLKVSSPFHSPHLRRVPVLLESDSKRIGFSPSPEDLKIPLYDTRDGRDLRTETDLALALSRMAVAETLDWDLCIDSLKSDASRIILLSFGPGTDAEKLCLPSIRGKSFLIRNLSREESLSSFRKEEEWHFPTPWKDYTPRYVKLPDGRGFIQNAYSVWSGRPPVFGGGMTPSTVEPEIVIAAAKDGYLVEWAGGGQVTEELFRKRMDVFRKELPPGVGIVVNLLYLDAYLWNLQLPLVKKLKSEGAPIDGVTISAGIPDVEEAVKILNDLQALGIWLNSFKPGTRKQIQQVIEIAKRIPDSNVLMQVEGGAAGGHHSWEDLEELIRTSYSEIRNCKNIILSVGGGLGDPKDASDWLNGTWAGENPMPVDAVFLGTRLMAAKECRTSENIKQALVSLEGAENWKSTQEGKSAGGVLSGKSGLGADIYYAQNTWTKISAFAEELTKGKEPEEARQNIRSKKEEIVRLLNSTAKPYFGDLERMSYTEILERYLELVCPGSRLVSPEGKWPDEPFIDISYRTRLFELVRRFESRLSPSENENFILQNIDELLTPNEFLKNWKRSYPEDKRVLPEDRIFFLDVCRRPGKPVNFIPALDEDLVKWIRSDSLWYSHCVGIDPDSCAWIPGPKAVSGIRKINEPVASIFSDFLKELKQGKQETVPDWSALFRKEEITFHFHDAFPEEEIRNGQVLIPKDLEISGSDWRKALSSLGSGFLSGLLQTPRLGSSVSDLALFFEPKAGRRFQWECSPTGELILLGILEEGKLKTELRLTDRNSAELALFFRHPKSGESISFRRKFHSGNLPGTFFEEDLAFGKDSLTNLYKNTWQIEENIGSKKEEFLESKIVLDRESILDFRKATGELRRTDLKSEPNPSLSMGITFAWKSLLLPLFGVENRNLLKLLHLSQDFHWREGMQFLRPGDELVSRAKLLRVRRLGSGQELLIGGEVFKDEKSVFSFKTGFLIREAILPFEEFDSLPIDKSIRIRSQAEIEILKSLSWIRVGEERLLQIGTKLRFRSTEKRSGKHSSGEDWKALGKIEIRTSNGTSVPWGEFDLQETIPLGQLSSLEKLFSLFQNEESEVPLGQPHRLLSETFFAPNDMSEYSAASGDSNPIHTDSDLARYAGWKDRIVHGLWTSSRTIKQIVLEACSGDASRMVSFEESFEAPVYLGEELKVEARHQSQSDGNPILSVSVENRNGEIKLRGKAEILPPKTGYVFTGQGSQSQGMGMKLREEFPEARDVWQRAENTTQKELGFSLLKIVQENPTSLRVGDKVWTHPKGVLNLTQFTQVALVTKSMADWEILKGRGFLLRSAPFAGHSLGEFSALSARGFLGLENVIRIVYNRGLTMQGLVPRDSEGRSPFGMSVVLGNRHVGLDEKTILKVVEEIRNKTGLPLEVVNLNIRDKQYSVTGDLKALAEMEAKFKEIVRGKKTTIRLEGIDVPFHSRVLVSGVDAFRRTLEENIPIQSHFEELDGKYIPNLVARPFSTSEEFLRKVQEISGSPRIAKILKESDPSSEQELRRILLIELLAYQFAMPVQWILTQDVFFRELGVRRLIDLGARGDLAGMARQTVRDFEDPSLFEILHIEENRNVVLSEGEDCEEASWIRSEEVATPEAKSEIEAVPKTIPVNLPVETPILAPSTSAVGSGDEASVLLTRKEALLALLAIKAGVRTEEISEEENIDNLFGGNSSKRNQVMADLGAEFKTQSLDGAHEKSIRELSKVLEEQSSYQQPGPYLRTTFEDTLKKFFPPDFGRTEVFKHLREERGLTESGVFALSIYLPLAVREGESVRKGPLSTLSLGSRLSGSKDAARWLDQAVDSYASARGIRIGKKSSQASGGAGGTKVDAAALEELERKYFGAEGIFGKTIRDFKSRLLGEDPYAEFLIRDRNQIREARNKISEIAPSSLFNEKKIVIFGNSEQWAKKKLLQLVADWESGRIGDLSFQEESYLSNHAGDLLEKALIHRQEIWKERIAFFPSKKDYLNELVERSEKLLSSWKPKKSNPPVFRAVHSIFRPRLEISEKGNWNFREEEEFVNPKAFLENRIQLKTSSNFGSEFERSDSETATFLGTLNDAITSGINFSGLKVLVTGAGPNSIALETVYALLSGGAEIVLTTTSYSSEKLRLYRRIFQKYGAKGSSLKIVPFSQGSLEDISKLSEWLVAKDWSPDILVPFGAVGEENSSSQLDESSLNSLQVMLLGVEKLVGTLGRNKSANGRTNSPLHVILPLSPNHGIFGRDGMYAETKLGLETLFRKKFSEADDWGLNTRIHGCVIGWVRGTGLMEANDIVAQALEEKTGVLTFSRREMGLLLACLVNHVSKISKEEVLKADFTGGLEKVSDLGKTLSLIRADLVSEAKLKKEIQAFRSELFPSGKEKEKRKTLAKEAYKYPSIPDKETLRILKTNPLPSLSETVCVVGFAEIGPGGSSLSRWELEKDGVLSLEASLELAWTMGFVKFQASDKGRTWTDSETGEAISEWEIKSKYEEKILAHSGIRIIDSESRGFDPNALFSFVDVVLEEDFFLPVSGLEEANEFKKAEPESTEVYHDTEKDKWFVRRKKGSQIKVRKAIDFSRKVAGQIPKGWDPARYGIPKDLSKQVDPITIYNIYCTCEAFLRAGLEPAELYRFLHPGLVGSTVGSGMGGMNKMKRMFQDFLLGKERQHDALQESLINVTAAWALTSYVGAYGPVQTPVAACATAGVSLEMAASLIREGKAGFMLAGAFDDFSEEGLVGFGDMQATASSVEMESIGIEPKAICRPNDVRRGGFVEAHGGGVILLARGDIALAAGLPVYGILAYAGSKTDGIQASIPAPGLGLLSVGAESKQETSPLRNALSSFGLTANDIGVAYKHDTSTKANDKNENKLLYNLLGKLGRSEGNLLPIVSQKSLTGHSKGGAAAWQTIGVLQALEEGVVTGNRNLEEVDPEMNEYSFLTFTDESLHFGKHKLKAGMLTTLGFGHIGALCLFVHSDYFLAAIPEEKLPEYLALRGKREIDARNRYHEIRMELGKPLYEKRTKSFFQENEIGMLLDADYRAPLGRED